MAFRRSFFWIRMGKNCSKPRTRRWTRPRNSLRGWSRRRRRQCSLERELEFYEAKLENIDCECGVLCGGLAGGVHDQQLGPKIKHIEHGGHQAGQCRQGRMVDRLVQSGGA